MRKTRSDITKTRKYENTKRSGAPRSTSPKRQRGANPRSTSPKRQRGASPTATRQRAPIQNAKRQRAPIQNAKRQRALGRKPPRPRETPADRAARALRLLAKIKETYPAATCALRHKSAYELLVATILSAQCTDERVNIVTPDLFRRYPDAAALSQADPAELEAAIRSTGFFRNKTRSLLGMARMVCDEFGGQIPDTMDGLLRLPGVARKTANCVLGTWFGKNDGIVVDTHVGRIAERLGLTPTARNSKDAERIERDLMEVVPREMWTWLAFALIDHGRAICTARKPKCDQCPLAPECPSAFKV